MTSTLQKLSGWGNYPFEPSHVSRPESRESLRDIVTEGDQNSYISRGLGRAYGDSALNRNGGVIDQTRLNHFLSFDSSTGTLECEGGVSLAKVIDDLLPQGWFLWTTPGTKFVTIGGAIASDVHGKNHHCHGSFSNSVVDFKLLTASGETFSCSRTENDRLFWATIGGMGLTGIVTSARIQLAKTESAYVNVDYRRTRNLSDTFDCFEGTNAQYPYSIAWIDSLATKETLGRAVVMLANDASVEDLPGHLQQTALRRPDKPVRSVPYFLPSWTLNYCSIKAFNAAYYARHRNRRALIDYDSFFYPLDGLKNWNRIYGRRGFVQYQALFPSATSRHGMRDLLEEISRSKSASFLAVLKSTGQASEGMLSFLYAGHTLALDFPYRGKRTEQLLARLDEIVLQHGGRLYLAKDSMMSAATFAAMYPRLDEFLEIKRWIDPGNRFRSSQSIRLGIP